MKLRFYAHDGGGHYGPRMDSAKTNDVRARIRICPECEHRMYAAANAMRRHGTQMARAIELAKTDLSEEKRQEAGANLVTSFNEADRAWNTYPHHLIEHGILPTSDES